MKTNTIKTKIQQTLCALAAIACLQPLAGRTESDNAKAEYKQFTGDLTRVDADNRTITLDGRWFWSNPTFHVGEPCLVLLQDQEHATLQDLTPGQRVHVRYRTADGVKIANQITEDNRTLTGHISSLDAESRKLQIKQDFSTKDFVAAPDCAVLGKEGAKQTLGDLQVGHRVTVTYLAGEPAKLAVKIEHSSEVFKGTLEAIDADTGQLRAQNLLTEHRFTMADPCPIVVDGKMEGELRDLRIGDKVLFRYDLKDGVRVASSIELQHTEDSPAPDEEPNQAKK